jgi:micrococcal nuclease
MTRAIDGDSGVVDSESAEIEVRFMGMNAPERDECFHQEASDRLAGLVEGQPIELEVIGTDQFDRTLAYVWRGEVLVNLDLVRDGFVVATTPAEEGDPHGETLLAAEEAAVSEERGLWSETVCGAAGPRPGVAVDVTGSQFDPAGPDEELLEAEWVTLVGDSPIDLDGWTIRDESSQHRCHLRGGTRISADEALVVTSADPCWDPGQSPVWNNGGDMVLLLDEAGRVVARHRYTG